ncbi:hypothetical protein [Rhodoferax aquaticus]|uniref:Uncharacterized protein n=1 Tax=Rhodoferax aquaticus TaxID=2527691 RepID=A0A515ESX7_9BURK|nr:hypothetical protein [Rhodoferax aquaticus]QDL55782.1 hypothetical protein EXZ61_17285 [Rhodoferax aquaticus]
MPIPVVQPYTLSTEKSNFDRHAWRSAALRSTLKPHACGAQKLADNALRRQWHTLRQLSAAALLGMWRWM